MSSMLILRTHIVSSRPLLTAWWWPRLKATLERTQRLAHSYTEQLLAVYPDRVQALGKGLAMDEERLKVSAGNTGFWRGREGGGERCWGLEGERGERGTEGAVRLSDT